MLKPCPFCGSDRLHHEDDAPQTHIYCDGCEMHWNWCAGDMDCQLGSQDAGIAAWNKRFNQTSGGES